MLALEIRSMKQFMSALLSSGSFDVFLLEEAVIATACTYQIDGHINKEFFSACELEDSGACTYDFVSWKSVRGLIFDLIKGRRTPLSFKFVLHLMPEHTASILSGNASSVTPEQVRAFVLTIKYDGEKALLLTGTSLHTFLPSKEPDMLWDTALKKYLSKQEIAYEEL